MSEIAFLLRLQTNCDKEIKVTPVTVTDAATIFTSRLTEGYTRKSFFGYNNSDNASGELYCGHDATVTSATGYPIPKSEQVELLIDSDLDIYFVAETGETGDLRVLEGA